MNVPTVFVVPDKPLLDFSKVQNYFGELSGGGYAHVLIHFTEWDLRATGFTPHIAWLIMWLDNRDLAGSLELENADNVFPLLLTGWPGDRDFGAQRLRFNRVVLNVSSI